MTSDLDIYRAAKLLLEQHGLKGASNCSAERIATPRHAEDRDGVWTWGKIQAVLLNLSDVRFRDDGLH